MGYYQVSIFSHLDFLSVFMEYYQVSFFFPIWILFQCIFWNDFFFPYCIALVILCFWSFELFVTFIPRYIFFLIFPMVWIEFTIWTESFVPIINVLLLNFVWTLLCPVLWCGAGPGSHFSFGSWTSVRPCQQSVLNDTIKHGSGRGFLPWFWGGFPSLVPDLSAACRKPGDAHLPVSFYCTAMDSFLWTNSKLLAPQWVNSCAPQEVANSRKALACSTSAHFIILWAATILSPKT